MVKRLKLEETNCNSILMEREICPEDILLQSWILAATMFSLELISEEIFLNGYLVNCWRFILI